MATTDVLSPALAELAARPHWVVWRRELRDGKPTKVPYNARTSARASSTDPSTWSTYEDAQARAWQYDGVGYVLSPDDPYTGVDLDHCRDDRTGVVETWAQTIVDSLDSYTEISPSRQGLRIFVRAMLPPHGRRKGLLELYADGRFLTITGALLAGSPTTIEERQHAVDVLHHRTFGQPKPAVAPRNGTAHTPSSLDDAALLDVALHAKNGEAFRALWNGDWSSCYSSQSEADLALCSHLAFYVGADQERIVRLVRSSGLYRDKWDRPDYQQRTIGKVLSTLGETYTPPGPRLGAAGEAGNGVMGETQAAYSWQTLRALVDGKPHHDVQLVAGLVWQGRTHWVFGQAGTGKTLLFLCAGMHVAAGKPFCGRAVVQGAVLMMQEDSPLSVIAGYVEDLADIYDINLAEIPFWITAEPGMRIVDELSFKAACAAVETAPQRPTLILLDAAEAITPADRFTPRELDPLKRFIQWCLARGITVVVIDHIRKESGGKDTGATDPIDKLYGGLPKRAMSDVMLYLSGQIGKGGARAAFVKFRGQAPPDLDVTYDSAVGFTVKTTHRVLNETERKVIAVFNNLRTGDGWVAPGTIYEGCPSVPERSVRRVLGQLVESLLVVREGERKDTRYRLNAATGGFQT